MLPSFTKAPSIIPIQLRLKLHIIPLIAVLFLAVYGQVVCPFLAGLPFATLVYGLSLIAIFHLALREFLFSYYGRKKQGTDAPVWVAQKASFVSWLWAGLFASIYHAWVYPDFPIESHLKLLTGYWALGAGILAQIDHIAVEHYFRKRGLKALGERVERMSRRLMRSIAVFTLVPGLVMSVMASRFVYEGYAHPGVAYEVSFLALVFFIVAMLVAWQYGQSLKKDTRDISSALKTISAGEFNVQLDTTRPDELGQVARGINDMAQGLALRERIRDLFGRFVNPAIAEQVIEDFSSDHNGCLTQAGQSKKVAILMSDIRDFTPLAENMPPEQLVTLLNGYFAEMVAAIQNNGGMVDKFIGDAVMAVFGLSGDETEEEICRNAVAAAQEMQQRLSQYNESTLMKTASEQFDGALKNGIGVHFGTVIAGCMGSRDRLEFTVMGTTVNIAARIESACKAPNPAIMFSAQVAKHIENSEAVSEFELKGLSEAITLYSLPLNKATS